MQFILTCQSGLNYHTFLDSSCLAAALLVYIDMLITNPNTNCNDVVKTVFTENKSRSKPRQTISRPRPKKKKKSVGKY